MNKKVTKFIPITILTSFAVIFFIAGASMFVTALKVMVSNPGAIPAAMLILVAFILSLGISTILSIIDLPLTITSIKKSDKKIYPVILLIIELIIIIVAIIFFIILIANLKK